MKKTIFTLFILAFASLFGANASYASSCDYTEYNELRYGYKYSFSDTFTNKEKSNQVALSKFDTVFTPQYDYNGSKAEPNFEWTNTIKNKNFHLNPNESMTVIETEGTYDINYHPVSRSRDNLLIKYNLEFYKKEGNKYI
jgi:hypothetical protein